MQNIENFCRIARTLMDALGLSIEEAICNPAIPQEYRDIVLEALEREKFIIRDPSLIEDENREHDIWLPNVDRNNWYYWPRLRKYLIDHKGWPIETVRSIDDATDRILGAMEDPSKSSFDTRGLVVGYVQSGKTANYTGLIAKAADTGYRLIIVLTGMHNTLRYQTQVRLDKELVGKLNGESVGVGIPISEKEWYTLTKADPKQGDFEPGNTGTAVLSYSKPVLIVTKKNGPVLRKLIDWLSQTQEHTRKNIPCLIIDDEADQASVNTGGNRPPEDDWDIVDVDNQDPPSTINGLIRQLRDLFIKKAYVAYTATPFANVLIDYEARDVQAGEDLYPKSFILALPRPNGYFGAREIFGTIDEEYSGIDVIRRVPITDIPFLVPERRSEVETFEPRIPESLKRALKDFILAGAARYARGQDNEPMAMLVHTSYRTLIQVKMARLLKNNFGSLRDEWRYFRDDLKTDLQKIWETEFRPVTRSVNVEFDMPFNKIEDHIGTFLEQVTFKELHGDSSDEIDYERDPNQKIIVIGGNRLSRGLTLEGLLVSYYVRPTPYYDTLMQMGRWFGYRNGYADVTRIYTTKVLSDWFRDLATVEEELHGEIAKYVYEGVTPTEVGVRIRQHPAMLVTSPLKMQRTHIVNISLANQTLQSITFPLSDYDWLRRNIEVTIGFLSVLGPPTKTHGESKPIWSNVDSKDILEYLSEYRTDPDATKVRADKLVDYITRQNENGELTNWVVAVIGRGRFDDELGKLDFGISGFGEINLINRSKIINTNSLKAIASADDQKLGLNEEQISYAEELKEQENMKIAEALRYARDPRQGLLLIYPISKYSTVRSDDGDDRDPTRERLFSDPDSAEHVIGIAVVFPHSDNAATVEYRLSYRFDGGE
ncbi:Z1 domain-containing protein [Neobacillus sp. NPDC093127]|uniref:Z1 domain-containing protein n=1 Tax=Neobacillus sp. NPDC093127 TaxID=3364296 RepID=UPI0037F4B9ED